MTYDDFDLADDDKWMLYPEDEDENIDPIPELDLTITGAAPLEALLLTALCACMADEDDPARWAMYLREQQKEVENSLQIVFAPGCAVPF